MFSDYKVEVVEYYKKMRDNGSLSLNLLSPTPAKLKNECLLVFQSGTTKSDMAILRQFFGHRENETDYARAIKTIETDKFRPLVNFLKEQTSDTDDKNIELLSWLIDFPPRPYKYGAEDAKDMLTINKIEEEAIAEVYDLDQQEKITIGGGTGLSRHKESILKPPIIGSKTNLPVTHWYQKKNNMLYGIALAVFALLLSFKTYLEPNSLFGFKVKESSCMYWATDHYVSADCDEKAPNVNIVAINTDDLKYFKKINRPDTLKLIHINKVWYSKINKVVEFYTAPGHHPEHPDKQLKPLSKYMFLKYVVKPRDEAK